MTAARRKRSLAAALKRRNTLLAEMAISAGAAFGAAAFDSMVRRCDAPTQPAAAPLMRLCRKGADFWLHLDPPGGPAWSINLGPRSDPRSISRRALLAVLDAQKEG